MSDLEGVSPNLDPDVTADRTQEGNQPQSTPEESKRLEISDMLAKINVADLLAVGISQDAIKAALEHGQAREQAEQAEKQKQNPFILIETALSDSAQTPEDKALANDSKIARTWEMGEFQKKFDEAKVAQVRSGRGELTLSDFLDRDRSKTILHATILRPRGRAILELPGDPNESVLASEEFQERVLQALGVLKSGETMDALKSLPEKPQNSDDPYSVITQDPMSSQSSDRVLEAFNLKTNIDGVTADVYHSKLNPIIRVGLDRSAVIKSLNNPA